MCWSETRAKERGLFQLHRQSLAKRLVKYGVARLILEIGQDNRIFLGEFRRPVKIESMPPRRSAPESQQRRQRAYALRVRQRY